jgi:hypothetical protein
MNREDRTYVRVADLPVGVPTTGRRTLRRTPAALAIRLRRDNRPPASLKFDRELIGRHHSQHLLRCVDARGLDQFLRRWSIVSSLQPRYELVCLVSGEPAAGLALVESKGMTCLSKSLVASGLQQLCQLLNLSSRRRRASLLSECHRVSLPYGCPTPWDEQRVHCAESAESAPRRYQELARTAEESCFTRWSLPR